MHRFLWSATLFVFLFTSLSAQVSRNLNRTTVPYRNYYQRVIPGYQTTADVRNGTIWGWGSSSNGLFAQPNASGTSVSNSQTPLQIAVDNQTWINLQFAGISAAGIRSNGSLWTWGWNFYGQLGLGPTGRCCGTPDTYSTPQHPENSRTWVGEALGLNHDLALKSDGTLWAWGSNQNGQLGLPGSSNVFYITQVGSDNNWIGIIASLYGSYGLKSNGTLWGWGIPYSNIGPLQLLPTHDWKAVAVGYESLLAIKADGTLWSWGFHESGQQGDGTVTMPGDAAFNATPVQVGTEHTWVSVATGRGHCLATKSDGTLWGWGLNDSYQVGNGTRVNALTPVQIGTDHDWIDVKAGNYNSFGFKGNGGVWAWGNNEYGVLGVGGTDTVRQPTLVYTLDEWLDLSAGGAHTLATRSNGTLWSWGDNASGQLGNGSFANSFTPARIGTGNSWISAVAGGTHSVALKGDGTLWAWGNNQSGQLGTGTTNNAAAPVQVGADNDWVSLAPGASHTLALKSNGTIWGWGANGSGQLGNSTSSNTSTPVQTGSDNHWVSVRSGSDHALGLKADGTLWSWGANANGQLGNGTTTGSSAPAQVGTDTMWTSMAAGAAHTLALKSNGTLWAWGRNNAGQLGNGTNSDAYAPLQVGTENNWIRVVAGNNYSMALKGDGTLWAWGDNPNGALGNGSTTASGVPVQVDSNVVVLTAGGSHSGLIHADRSTLCETGANGSGQLGDGSTSDRSTFSCQSSALPVQFGSFTAQKKGEAALLNWSTAQEQNSLAFIVERSANGTAFDSIGRVAAAGFSTTFRSYSFTDNAPQSGNNYYRLRQVDKDNSVLYSPVQKVVMDGAVSGFAIVQNPVQGSLQLRITLQATETLNIQVRDASGHAVIGQTVTGRKGNALYNLAVDRLTPGTYFVQVQGSSFSSTKAFLKR